MPTRYPQRRMRGQYGRLKISLVIDRPYGIRPHIPRREQQQRAELRNREAPRSNPILSSLPLPSRSPALRLSSQLIGWPSTSCRFTASAVPMHLSSTATHPIELGETSSHFP